MNPVDMNWSQMLSQVHKYAWETWKEKLSEKTGYKLPGHSIQVPGTVGKEVMDSVADAISSLPPVTKYTKH